VNTGFWWGNLWERDHLGDPGVDGRIIIRWIFRKWDVGGMDWIELVQDRDRWRTIVRRSEGKKHLEDPGVDGRTILNGSSGSGMWGYGLDRAGSG